MERAVEEEATEVFVRHEIPFDLELVGSLMTDIGSNLAKCGSEGDHTLFHTQPLPQLKVVQMDDITSCLDLLRDYSGSWSRMVSKKAGKLLEESRSLKVQ